jgi:hypothetical protein
LRVKIRNSKECRTELSFPDLSVKYNNGYAPSLKLKEGEEIPMDVLDPEDVRKSLKVGSLKGYTDSGWIEEIKDEPTPPADKEFRLSHFITEQMIDSPGMIAPLKPLPVVAQAPKQTPLHTNLPEEVPEIEKAKVTVIEAAPITDLTLVKTYEDFEKLSHFLKLRFIKDCSDISLLKDILGKTPSVQFKNNITLRLTQIKI